MELLREHFGDDERGRTRILRFLPWHLGFFCRYRPFPGGRVCRGARGEHPLLQTRPERDLEVSPLETLLRDARAAVHETLAPSSWRRRRREEALERALRLQATLPATAEIGETREPVAEVAG